MGAKNLRKNAILYVIFSLALSVNVFAGGKGGGGPVGGGKGNGGNTEGEQEAIGALAHVDGNSFYINFHNKSIQELNDSKNISCDYIQGLMSYGLRLIWFLELNHFDFKDPKGNSIKLKRLDALQIINEYADPKTNPGACVDLREHPEIDPKTSKAHIFLQNENTFDNRSKLMGMNFPETGKIFIFANNWLSADTLSSPNCHIELESGYKDDPLYEFEIAMGGLQRNCLFLNHLAVGTHEILSAQGVVEEQNGKYYFSSYYPELLSLNLSQPRERSLAFMQAFTEYYQASFDVHLQKQLVARKLFYALIDRDLSQIPANAVATFLRKDPMMVEYLRAVKNTRRELIISTTSRDQMFFLTELIVPTKGSRIIQRLDEAFKKEYFDFSDPKAFRGEFLDVEFLKSVVHVKKYPPELKNPPIFDNFVKMMHARDLVTEAILSQEVNVGLRGILDSLKITPNIRKIVEDGVTPTISSVQQESEALLEQQSHSFQDEAPQSR